MEIMLKEICRKVGGKIVGKDDLLIRGVAGLSDAKEGEISFVANPRYKSELKNTKASAVILKEPVSDLEGVSQIIVDDPYYTFSQIISIFYQKEYKPTGISKDILLGKDVKLGTDLSIHSFVTIGDNAKIGDRVTIQPFTYIGEGSEIGDDTIIYPNVTVREKVIIGKRVIIHSGVVIGSDGFGFVTHKGRHHKILQVGTVIIEDDVEIGANVTIDRAALDKTLIKRGTKIDNLVHIAHNVSIGEDTLLIAQVGISGSSKVGKSSVLAGQVGVVGHVEIGDNVMVGARSVVTKDINSNQVVSGFPAIPHKKWLKIQAVISQLPEMRNEIEKLKSEINNLRLLIK